MHLHIFGIRDLCSHSVVVFNAYNTLYRVFQKTATLV